jgi:tetratricopeptide (TPR) repeat protein
MALGYLRTTQYPLSLAGALTAYERAIALDRFNAEALHQYGSALAMLGRDSAATAVLHQALSTEPQRPVTLYELSYIEWINRRFASSLRWADSVVAIDPTFFLGYEQRGFARFFLGDTAGARRDGEAAVRLGDLDYGESLMALMEVAARDTASARARIDRLREAVRDPERPTVFQSGALAIALVAVGDTAAALDALERAQPRGALLWYNIRGLVGLQPSPRLERLIRVIRPQ